MTDLELPDVINHVQAVVVICRCQRRGGQCAPYDIRVAAPLHGLAARTWVPTQVKDDEARQITKPLRLTDLCDTVVAC